MSDTGRKYQHHPIEFKREVVEASFASGVSMAALAREHGINANQLWSWRKLYKEGRLEVSAVSRMSQPALLAVDVIAAAPSAPVQVQDSGRMEIRIGQTSLSVTGSIDPLMLKTAIAALRA